MLEQGVEQLAITEWDRGGARPVIALHCSLAHSGAFGGLAQGVQGVHLFAIDQPGHGRAADWDGVRDQHGLALENLLRLVGQVKDARGRVDLIGHSFGGTVALRFAVENPECVRSLTLIEPVYFAAARAQDGPVWKVFQEHFQRVEHHVQIGALQDAARIFLSRWGDGEPLESLPEKSRKYMVDRIHLIPAQKEMIVDDRAGVLAPGQVERVRCPVLLVEGAASPAIIGDIHQALADRLPHVRRLVVPGAGHMVTMTHAAQIVPEVMALWAES